MIYGRSFLPQLQRRISTGYYNGDSQQQSGYYPIASDPQQYQQGDYSQVQQTYQQGPLQVHHYPQYIEAPEPIIEIIIKDSNDTLELPPQEPVYVNGKKKKEEVQVFYVKYKNDPHRGVIIDDPVAALSPTSHHQENEDYGEELPQNDEQQPLIVTLPPPVKSTTLRTIIRPDSEKFHSNSGIHVTFGTEDKSQHGHQLQEENVESNIEPVLALPTATVAPQTLPAPAQQQQQHHHQHHPHHNQIKFHDNKHFQQQSFQNNEFHSRFGQQARYYNTNNNNEVFPPLAQGLVNGHQQLPFVNSPSQPFRHAGGAPPTQSNQQFNKPSFNAQATNFPRPQYQPRHPEQDRNLVGSSATPFVQQLPSFAPPPPFRSAPQQGPPQLPPPAAFHSHQQQRPHGPPPQGHFNQPPSAPPSPPVRFPTAQNQFQPPKYRPNQIPIPPQPAQQPPQHRPIPIPLHQFDQPKPQSHHQGPPPPAFHQQPLPQFNGANQQPFRHSQREPLQVPVNNAQHFNNFNVQTSVTPLQSGGLVQQPAPNLSREQPQPHHQLQVQQQQQQQQQYHHQQQHNTQQFQNNQHQAQQQQQSQPQNQNNLLNNIQDIASGGELIQSVAKYEQHIIEQAPQFHYSHQQQVNYSPVFSSTAAPVQKQNIGPLAHNIGHLNTSPSSTAGPLRASQPEFQQTVQHQQFIQQQISHILEDPQTQQAQYQQQIQPQITHNSQPAQPGQSVSTHYTENFPNLEQKRQQYYKSFISNQPQDQLQQVVINGRNNANNQGQTFESSSIYTPTTSYSTTTPRVTSTSQAVYTTPKETQTPTPTTQRSAKKPNNVILPDEVPDDLREQLFSSGILDNADISVLDYDKIGSTNLENLPPEHLANFFNAGGGSQIAASHKMLSVVKPNGEKVNLDYNDKEKLHTKKTLDKTLPQKQNVDLKVVRFDSTNQKSVSDKYIKSDSAVLPTVEVNSENHQYNRYLPLKLNGAQFPIPDVPELRGKRIASVVVLAPVDNSLNNGEDEGRYERDVTEQKQVKFIAGDALKLLIKKPTKENFKKWLEKEANTDIDFQSVVLLVAK